MIFRSLKITMIRIFKISVKWKMTRLMVFSILLTVTIVEISNIRSKPNYPQNSYEKNKIEINKTGNSKRNHVSILWNTRLNHEWILNKKILQYSSYIKAKPNGKINVESIIMPVDPTSSYADWKCVVKQTANSSISLYPVQNTFKINRLIQDKGRSSYTTQIQRVTCKITRSDKIDDQTLVAIIDR